MILFAPGRFWSRLALEQASQFEWIVLRNYLMKQQH